MLNWLYQNFFHLKTEIYKTEIKVKQPVLGKK